VLKPAPISVRKRRGLVGVRRDRGGAGYGDLQKAGVRCRAPCVMKAQGMGFTFSKLSDNVPRLIVEVDSCQGEETGVALSHLVLDPPGLSRFVLRQTTSICRCTCVVCAADGDFRKRIAGITNLKTRTDHGEMVHRLDGGVSSDLCPEFR